MQAPAALVLELEPSSASVPTARRAVTDWARDVVSPDLVEMVALLVSELATNAVLHAPWRGQRNERDVGGWGLDILEQLSDTWGIQELDDRKAVWFELVEAGA